MTRTLYLPSRRRKVKMGTRKDDGPIRCDAHLQWVRGFECCVANINCEGRTEAAHVRKGLAGGMGVKPGDDRAVPLCAHHHREQHRVGERSFWMVRPHVDPLQLAERLWQQSPAGQRWRARQESGE